jgi:hypothetical protein
MSASKFAGGNKPDYFGKVELTDIGFFSIAAWNGKNEGYVSFSMSYNNSDGTYSRYKCYLKSNAEKLPSSKKPDYKGSIKYENDVWIHVSLWKKDKTMFLKFTKINPDAAFNNVTAEMIPGKAEPEEQAKTVHYSDKAATDFQKKERVIEHDEDLPF